MNTYQKPEVEVLKFDTLETVMTSGGMIGGATSAETELE